MKNVLYKFGKFIQEIVIKNIVLFITLGFLKWLSLENQEFENILDVFNRFVIPLSIAFTTGNTVEKKHGGIGSIIGTAFIISFSKTGNLLEIILISSCISFTIKYFKEKFLIRIIPGFEMFVINIFVPFTAFLYFFIYSRMFFYLNEVFRETTEFFINIGGGLAGIVFLTTLIQAGKVFFINNFINHGILALIGYEEVAVNGSSIFFLLETNPGPGLGLLTALYFFAKKEKSTLFFNMMIEFIGGIHEVYFSYVLKNLKLIGALIIGGVAGNIFFFVFDVGLFGIPSPGSAVLIAFLSAGSKISVLTGIFLSATVSFAAAYMILHFENEKKTKGREIFEKSEIEAEKIKTEKNDGFSGKRKVVILCDGGMGSSSIGKNILIRELEKRGLKGVNVSSSYIGDAVEKSDLIITHRNFKNDAEKIYRENKILYFDDYMDKKFYNDFIEKNLLEKNEVWEEKFEKEEEEKEGGIEINMGLRTIPQEKIFENFSNKLEAEKEEDVIFVGGKIYAVCFIDEKKSEKIIIEQYPYGIECENGQDIYITAGIRMKSSDRLKKTVNSLENTCRDESLISELEISDDAEKFKNIFGGLNKEDGDA